MTTDKTTINSLKEQITPQTGTGEAGKGDYPPALPCTIALLLEMETHRHRVSVEYGLQGSSYKYLLLIVGKWLIHHKGSTVYSLTMGNTGRQTYVSHAVRALFDKGLVEMIGKGYWNSNVYAPSRLGMSLFSDLCPDVMVTRSA